MGAAKTAGRAFVVKNCGTAAAAEVRQRAEPAEPSGEAWIEVAVVDLDGRPIPHQPVLLEDADGRVHTRFSDQDGLVRLDGLPPAPCDITLPDLDASSWEPA